MRRNGFALLIVLWTLVPVSVLFLTLSGAARSDSHLAFNLRDAAKLQAAADGGIASAMFELLRDPDGTAPLRLRISDAVIAVQVKSLGGLVNPNTAPVELLRSLLQRIGADPARATLIAAAIVQWRTPAAAAAGRVAAQYLAAGLDYAPPGALFQSIAELRDVIGMTPAIYEALLPALSLYNDRPPDPALAPPLVRAALGDLGATPRPAARSDTFLITAEALEAAGSRTVRAATVRFGPSPTGRPWTVLTWATVSD